MEEIKYYCRVKNCEHKRHPGSILQAYCGRCGEIEMRFVEVDIEPEYKKPSLADAFRTSPASEKPKPKPVPVEEKEDPREAEILPEATVVLPPKKKPVPKRAVK